MTISRVVSGQTLDVLPMAPQSSASVQRVRLLGIDAPDWEQQPWSNEAKVALETLIDLKQPVLLEFDRQKQVTLSNGTPLQLAYVWQDGILLNEKLVEIGQALAMSRSPNTKYDKRFTHAQEKARLLGVGIWNPNAPMRQTPDEFRKQKQP